MIIPVFRNNLLGETKPAALFPGKNKTIVIIKKFIHALQDDSETPNETYGLQRYKIKDTFALKRSH